MYTCKNERDRHICMDMFRRQVKVLSGTVWCLQVSEAFRRDSSQVDTAYCEEQYASLHRIDTNVHRDAYAYTPRETVTGMTLEDLRYVNSTQAQQDMLQQQRSTFTKVKDYLREKLGS